MSKGATALSIIALVVGLTTFGFGYFEIYDRLRPRSVDPLTSYILLTEWLDPPTEILETWFISYSGSDITSGTLILGASATIVITGIEDVNLYLCFMSEVLIVNGINMYSLQFLVDGSPVGLIRTGLNNNWTSISLQTVVTGVKPGTHTIQIQASISGGASVRVGYPAAGYGQNLLIQSYI